MGQIGQITRGRDYLVGEKFPLRINVKYTSFSRKFYFK